MSFSLTAGSGDDVSPGSIADAVDDALAAQAETTSRHGLLALRAGSLLLMLCAVLAIVGLALRNSEADLHVTHIVEVRLASQALLFNLKAAEAGVRGFLLTGDHGYLTQHDSAEQHIPDTFVKLRDLVADNPNQLARLAVVQPLIAQRLASLDEAVEQFRHGAMHGQLGAIPVGNGKPLMARIHATIDDFDQTEVRLLARRRDAAAQSRDLLLACGVVAVALAVGLVILTGAITQRRAQKLRASNDRLGATVRARTRALYEAQTRFRQVFDDIPLGLGILRGEDQRIVAANPTLCRLLGSGEADLGGRSLAGFIHPDDRPPAARHGNAGGDPATPAERRYVTPDGDHVHARTRSVRLRAADEAGDLTLTIIEDISREKQIEATLMRAQRLEAIGELTGGVAHDFNNLLGVILGNAEILLDAITTPAELEMITDILTSAERGEALTRRLLAFARRQMLQPAVVDLAAYLPAHVNLLQRTLGETIRINTILATGLWAVHVDPSQAADALLNLAINARDAMPGGGVLTIETANVVLDAAYCADHEDTAPGEYVVLSVTDTGTGMPPEVAARAVEPFFTTKPIGHGTGLGLSMAYGFARQSGGHLSIDSAPGAGTAIRLFLPRARDEAADAPADRVPDAPRGSGASILVVDDNDAVRMMAIRSLVSLGYNVAAAENGPAALALLRSGQRFDLLFSDVVMPAGMSGYQLADAATDLHPGIRVLFCTGYPALQGGAAAVKRANMLQKPYHRLDLAKAVRTALERVPAQV